MKFRTETREVGSLELRAEVTSVDEKNRTFDLVWSTGARVLRNSWFSGPSYEELSMDPAHVRMGRLQSGRAPFLANHDGYDVTRQPGVVTAARLENGKGTATVRMDDQGQDPDADRLFGKIARGIVRNVSVGYRTYKAEEVGAVGKVPVLRSVDWEPFEISSVSIPADADAGTRSEQSVQSNPCVFLTREQEQKNVEKTEEEKRAEAAKAEAVREASRQAELTAAREQGAKEERDKAQRKAERETAIRGAVKAAKLGDDLAKRLIDDQNVTVEGARKAVLDELATRSETTAIDTHARAGVEVGEEDRDKWIRGASLALLQRTGMLPVIMAAVAIAKDDKRRHSPAVRANFRSFDVDEDSGRFRELSLFELAKESLERHNVRGLRNMTKDQVVGLAFTHRAGDATISDFSVLLENVMYKTLLGAYAQTPDTWRRFCGTDSVNDFRPANRYRTGTFGPLDVIGESGEYKSKSIPDGQKVQITTESKGNMIAVSRQAIINDDMGAIVDTINKLGRAAALSIEKEVYTLLAENAGLGPNVTISGTGGGTHPLFDAAWGNEGIGGAINMANIEANRVLMASQKDISGNEFLELRPSVLLVPIGLEGTAKQLNRDAYDPTPGAAFQAPNIVAGLFSDIIGTPRLSGTRRYMFAPPGEVAAMKVVFLNGAEAPFMDQQLGWRVDGTEYKIRIDFKSQAFDPKAALTDAGA